MTKHPSGLYLLFVTEMWERFSYYGMRALFVLFLVKALAFSLADASELYGSFTGLVYLSPLLGGYISDKYWGNRRSIITGGLVMALGHFCLFLSSSWYLTDRAALMMYLGLTFLIVGNGFFKPNISTLVGQLYDENDVRKDSAYTLFYMGINLGAFFSPLVCGYLGDTDNPADFKYGFLAACIGMLIGLLIFVSQKNSRLLSPTGQPIGSKPVLVRDDDSNNTLLTTRNVVFAVLCVVVLAAKFFFDFGLDFIAYAIFAACIIVPVYIISEPSLTSIERKRILVIYILAFFVIFFWAAYEQAGNSITMYTETQIDRTIGDFTVSTSYFQSVNPVLIILLVPVVSACWTWLAGRKRDLSVCQKQALGILLLSGAYAVLAFGTHDISPEVKQGMSLVIMYYFMSTVGELCLSPVGLSMVNKLSPARFASLLMGVWFMSSAAANKFCGILGALYPTTDASGHVVESSFLGYHITGLYDFFLLFVIMTLVSAVILFAISNKLDRLMAVDNE